MDKANPGGGAVEYTVLEYSRSAQLITIKFNDFYVKNRQVKLSAGYAKNLYDACGGIDCSIQLDKILTSK